MAEVIEARLAAYLDQAGRTPFAWGRADCCTFAADWAELVVGVDPMTAWRGRYRTRLGAQRLLGRDGGLGMARLWREALVDFTETAEPAIGDIGLVAIDRALAGGVRTRLGWAVKTLTGLLVLPELVATTAWEMT